MNSKIAEMVGDLQDQAQKKKRQAQEELDRRRSDALVKIGQAAEKHGLDMSASITEEMVRERMRYAQALRISQAESVAQLAFDRGDFTSEVAWWDLKAPGAGERDSSLWKGYVVREPVLKARFWVDAFGAETHGQAAQADDIKIEARYACEGIYVACVEGDAGVCVGFSKGKDKSPADAVEAAYRNYFPGMGTAPLPDRLAQLMEAARRGDTIRSGLDRQVEAGIG